MNPYEDDSAYIRWTEQLAQNNDEYALALDLLDCKTLQAAQELLTGDEYDCDLRQLIDDEDNLTIEIIHRHAHRMVSVIEDLEAERAKYND